MTSNAVRPEKIERLAQSKGPVTAAASLGIGAYSDEALITALAEGASRRNVLISADDEALLDSLTGSRFFEVQIILDEVIPKLRAPPPQIMGLVRRLVAKGGERLCQVVMSRRDQDPGLVHAAISAAELFHRLNASARDWR
ncbi:MAG: hypothetical protein ABJL67_11230 [Sulfitobacter sp.]